MSGMFTASGPGGSGGGGDSDNSGPFPVDEPGDVDNELLDLLVRDPTQETVFAVPEEVNEGINYATDNTLGDAVYDATTPGDDLGSDRANWPGGGDGGPGIPGLEKIVIGLVAVLALLVGINAFAGGAAEGLTS